MLHTSGKNKKIIKDHLSSPPKCCCMNIIHTVCSTTSLPMVVKGTYLQIRLFFNSHLNFCGFLQFESSIKPKIIPRGKHSFELFSSLYCVDLVLLNSQIFLQLNEQFPVEVSIGAVPRNLRYKNVLAFFT